MNKYFFLPIWSYIVTISWIMLIINSCGRVNDNGNSISDIDSNMVLMRSHPPFKNGLEIPNTDFFLTVPNDKFINPSAELRELIRYSAFPSVIIVTDSGFILPNNEHNSLYHYDFSGRVIAKADFLEYQDSYGPYLVFMCALDTKLFMAFSGGNIFEFGKTKPLFTEYNAPYRFSISENNILYLLRNISPPTLHDKMGYFRGGIDFPNTTYFGYPNDFYLLNDTTALTGELSKENRGIRIFIGNESHEVRDTMLQLNFDIKNYSLRIIFANDSLAHMIIASQEKAYHINLNLLNMKLKWKRLDNRFENPDNDLLLWFQTRTHEIIPNNLIYAYHSGYLYSLYTTKTYFKLFREKL